jgi:hypothetical protein
MVAGRFTSAIRAFLSGEPPPTLPLAVSNVHSFAIIAAKVPIEDWVAVRIDE